MNRASRRSRIAIAIAASVLIVSGCSGSDPAVNPSASNSSSTQAVDTTGQSSATASALPNETVDRLNAALVEAIETAEIPGALVGIFTPNGPRISAFGTADKQTGDPMEPGLFIRIGSETKTFTVTAVLQLVDAGKLGLDDPIGKYLDGVPNGDTVTIRQLAEMRSGIPSYSLSEPFVTQLLGDPAQQFSPDQLLGFAYALPTLFAPGAEFNYSNTNTILLGLLVEKLSGQTLPDYLQEHVFDQLGLPSTSFPIDATFPSPHAQGYTMQTLDGQEAVATDWNPSWGWAAGAMISRIEDLGVWSKALAAGTLLSPELQAERLEVVPISADNPDIGYGLGLFNVNGWIGHDGSLPGYQSLTIYLPEAETGIVVLVNTDIGVPVQNGTAVANPSAVLGNTITSILTPDHVFELPATPLPPDTSSSAETAPSTG